MKVSRSYRERRWSSSHDVMISSQTHLDRWIFELKTCHISPASRRFKVNCTCLTPLVVSYCRLWNAERSYSTPGTILPVKPDCMNVAAGTRHNVSDLPHQISDQDVPSDGSSIVRSSRGSNNISDCVFSPGSRSRGLFRKTVQEQRQPLRYAAILKGQ